MTSAARKLCKDFEQRTALALAMLALEGGCLEGGLLRRGAASISCINSSHMIRPARPCLNCSRQSQYFVDRRTRLWPNSS